MKKIEIVSNQDNVRADILIASMLPEISRSAAQKLIKDGNVILNDKPLIKSTKLLVGDKLEIFLPEKSEQEILPEDIKIDIIYEDDDVLIINKSKGMVVHPAAGNYSGTLVNALLNYTDHLSNINGEQRPGIVHRIDKDTSGLLLVAKTNEAHENLADQLKAHDIKREYCGVVYGNIKDEIGTVNEPIGRNPKDRKKMAAISSESSRDAVTHYEVIKRFKGFTQMKFMLETGRTHQIRVHMAKIGHPIAGDIVYGPKKAIRKLKGQCLHAKTLGFIHPKTGNYMEFTSELPNYFTDFLKRLLEQ